MDHPGVKRRLTCILATDAVGYSRLVSENEASALRVLPQPCLDRLIASIDMLLQDTKAWAHERIAKQTGVDWQFTTDDARMRLKRLYPQYQD